jgi:hypothetical protein
MIYIFFVRKQTLICLHEKQKRTRICDKIINQKKNSRVYRFNYTLKI